MSRPVASEIRAPVPYRNSSSARSRRTRGSRIGHRTRAGRVQQVLHLGDRDRLGQPPGRGGGGLAGRVRWRQGRTRGANACRPRTAITARAGRTEPPAAGARRPLPADGEELGHVRRPISASPAFPVRPGTRRTGAGPAGTTRPCSRRARRQGTAGTVAPPPSPLPHCPRLASPYPCGESRQARWRRNSKPPSTGKGTALRLLPAVEEGRLDPLGDDLGDRREGQAVRLGDRGAGQVPAWVFRPAARAGSARSASRQPRLAISTA